MDLTCVKRVQEWVELDNMILKNKEQIQEKVEKKKQLEEEILDYVETNKLENLCLNISDGTIKFCKRTSTQPLSMKTLRQLLEKYNKDKNSSVNINDICDFIATNLEKKNQTYLKRDIKDD